MKHFSYFENKNVNFDIIPTRAHTFCVTCNNSISSLNDFNISICFIYLPSYLKSFSSKVRRYTIWKSLTWCNCSVLGYSYIFFLLHNQDLNVLLTSNVVKWKPKIIILFLIPRLSLNLLFKNVFRCILWSELILSNCIYHAFQCYANLWYSKQNLVSKLKLLKKILINDNFLLLLPNVL